MNDSETLTAIVTSIQVGLPMDIGDEAAADPADQLWHSGFYKSVIAGPVFAGRTQLAGDGQADLSVHGGPDRPILAYCAEHYPRWSKELGRSDIGAGWFGENLTLSGLDESNVCLGDAYRIGTVLVQASQPRQPCWKLARRWRNKELPALVIKTGRGGWYFRVLVEGVLEAGMTARLEERPYPMWSINQANDVMYRGKDNHAATRELAACPVLSDDWRNYFQKREEGQVQ